MSINHCGFCNELDQVCGQFAEEKCENCYWFLVDYSVGIMGQCECDSWNNNITDQQIEQFEKNNGFNCPEFKKRLV